MPVPTPMPLPVSQPAPAPLPRVPDAQPWSADGPLSIDSPLSVDSPPSVDAPVPAPRAPSIAALGEPAAPALLAPCASCGTSPEPDDLYCAECGRPLSSDTRAIEPLPAVAPVVVAPAVVAPPVAAPREAAPPVEAPTEVAPEPPAPVVLAPAPAALPTPDVESTRIVPRGTGGARFVLQFSTGESYTVLGSGLAGRNPHPEPGEYVDHLVTIVDPGRSVSKTHFEFGQQGGVFWFSDRHSGNGSTLREPGAEPRPCEPGRRYPVVRGTRIDIGEQFVVVS